MTKNAETKAFYADVFGWSFTDWGPDYISFDGAGIDGGFNGTGDVAAAAPGVLIVLYAEKLQDMLHAVEAAGGQDHKTDLYVSGWCAVSFQRSERQ